MVRQSRVTVIRGQEKPGTPVKAIREAPGARTRGPTQRVPKNTPDASRTSLPLSVPFDRTARPEGLAIQYPVRPQASGFEGRRGPKALSSWEPFGLKGRSGSRAHDPEGSERASHHHPGGLRHQSEGSRARQILVDNDSRRTQFIHSLSTGSILCRELPSNLNIRAFADQCPVVERGAQATATKQTDRRVQIFCLRESAITV